MVGQISSGRFGYHWINKYSDDERRMGRLGSMMRKFEVNIALHYLRFYPTFSFTLLPQTWLHGKANDILDAYAQNNSFESHLNLV